MGALALGLSCAPHAEPHHLSRGPDDTLGVVARPGDAPSGAASTSTAAPTTSAELASGSVAAPSPHGELFSAEPRVRSVPLPEFEALHVVLPRGDGSKKARLAVIAHGAGERPEPHCEHYARLLGDSFLLACTRGHPNNRHLPEPERGYFYDGHPRLGRELAALFGVLEREAPFAGHVELEGALYAGFSQGATMGVLALHEEPELAARFSALLLIDGGTGDWTVALAERMAARGVKVALVCGVATCREKARHTEPWLAKAKLDAKIRLTSAGHRLDGAVEEEVRELLPWLLTSAPTPSAAGATDPCSPMPKHGSACKAGSGFCVESWGTPGGRSSALWCRDGRWHREEEDNLP